MLAALSGLAVTQPLLDLFGRNPEFFVAQHVTSTEIVLFALVATFAVPLAGLTVELLAFAVGDRVGRTVHVSLVLLLATVLGSSLAVRLDLGDVAHGVLAVVVGAALTVATVRIGVVEQILRYLAAGLLLFLVAFLFGSRTGELLRTGEASAASGVEVGAPAPVIVVQLDALPAASLIRADGSLNDERFPGFARLAAGSTWFRNATSVSASTTDSVPSVLTGVLPEPGALPTSGDHPRNLFTLLGEHYELVVNEQVTDLCPGSICGQAEVEPASSAGSGAVLRDAAVVLGHLTVPPTLAEDLAAVDQSWGGFLAGGAVEAPAAVSGSAPSSPFSKWDALGPEGWTPRSQAAVLDAQVDALRATSDPTLWYSHAVFPHGPWQLNPSGLQYQLAGRRVEGVEDSRWVDDEWTVRQGFQRHLLQVGYADTLIGRLIDRLESGGLWEDALVVVTADHGVAFEPGSGPRNATRDTVHEVYNVPLFIKAPGETAGTVRDDNALLVDVLPSIIDLLEIDVGWEVDGRSLFGADAEPGSKPVVGDPEVDQVPDDLDGLLDVAERNERRLPHGDDVAAIASVGELGRYVGRSVASLPVVGRSRVSWSLDQTEVLERWRPGPDGFAPTFWKGRLAMPDGSDPPPEMLAIVNGRVAGIVGGFGAGDSAPDQYSALIDESVLEEGTNEVSLLVPVGRGNRFEQTGGPAGGGD